MEWNVILFMLYISYDNSQVDTISYPGTSNKVLVANWKLILFQFYYFIAFSSFHAACVNLI